MSRFAGTADPVKLSLWPDASGPTASDMFELVLCRWCCPCCAIAITSSQVVGGLPIDVISVLARACFGMCDDITARVLQHVLLCNIVQVQVHCKPPASQPDIFVACNERLGETLMVTVNVAKVVWLCWLAYPTHMDAILMRAVLVSDTIAS